MQLEVPPFLLVMASDPETLAVYRHTEGKVWLPEQVSLVRCVGVHGEWTEVSRHRPHLWLSLQRRKDHEYNFVVRLCHSTGDHLLADETVYGDASHVVQRLQGWLSSLAKVCNAIGKAGYVEAA